MALVANTRGEWAHFVKKTYARKNYINYDLAVDAILKMGYDKFYSPNTTIIDAYPGLGVWSAALHNTLKPKQHIMLEPHLNYRKFLSSLCNEKNTLQVLKPDPFRWTTFTSLIQEGIYSPEKQPRTHINNELIYTANLTRLQGEQLCTQYLNCIANQSWLQAYGRVRLLVWVRESTALKLLAPAGHRARHRVGIQREAVTEGTSVLGLNPEVAKAISKKAAVRAKRNPDASTSHYQPLVTAGPEDFSPPGTAIEPAILLDLSPLEHQVKYVDSFEYVIKNICILRNRPLKEALTTLGPGATEDLGPKIPDLLELSPQDLTLDQVMRVVEAFELWPFKPRILHDFYEASELHNL